MHRIILTPLLLAALISISYGASLKDTDLVGEWNRTNVFEKDQAKIKILRQDESGFWFGFWGLNGANIGELGGFEESADGVFVPFEEGAAILEGQCPIEDKGDMRFMFTLEGGILKVEQLAGSGGPQDYCLGFGMNVWFDGEYVKGPPVYHKYNDVDKLFGENKEKIKQLVGDGYSLVEYTIENDPNNAEIPFIFSGKLTGLEDVRIAFKDEYVYCCIGQTLYTNDFGCKKGSKSCPFGDDTYIDWNDVVYKKIKKRYYE